MQLYTPLHFLTRIYRMEKDLQDKSTEELYIASGLSTLLVHACALFCLCTSYRNFHMSYFCVKMNKNSTERKEEEKWD